MDGSNPHHWLKFLSMAQIPINGSNYYRWLKFPTLPGMVEWASGDVKSLFLLREAQISNSSDAVATQGVCPYPVSRQPLNQHSITLPLLHHYTTTPLHPSTITATPLHQHTTPQTSNASDAVATQGVCPYPDTGVPRSSETAAPLGFA